MITVDDLYSLIESRLDPEELIRLLIDEGYMDFSDLIDALEEFIWEGRTAVSEALDVTLDDEEEEEDDTV